MAGITLDMSLSKEQGYGLKGRRKTEEKIIKHVLITGNYD